MSVRLRILSLLVPLIVATACAGTPERPVEELTRARTLIEQAEKTGGQQHAAGELERARSKLNAAEAAASDGKLESARQLAAEAALDAEYASALAAAADSRNAAEELEKSVEALRQEAARNPDGSVRDPT